MSNIYDNRRIWKIVFLAVSVVLVAFFLHVSNKLVEDLSVQERERMEIWANATKALATAPINSSDASMQSDDIDFYLSIIRNNNNIPVLLVDDSDNILMYRNFRLPDPVDTLMQGDLTKANEEYLAGKLRALKNTRNHIPIAIDSLTTQHLYYEDSTLLTNMSYFPKIQLGVMIIFVLIVYFAVMSTKRQSKTKCGWGFRRKRPINWARLFRR